MILLLWACEFRSLVSGDEKGALPASAATEKSTDTECSLKL